MSTESIVEHHMEALLTGDIDEVMKDYADDAVMITAGMGTAEGSEALRTTFPCQTRRSLRLPTS